MRRTIALIGIVIVAAIVATTEQTPAQEGMPIGPGSAVTPRDSAAILRSARSDQAAFEYIRRNRLPERWGSSGGRCDERIGRFCLTHGTGGGERVIPPEDERVVQARLDLVEKLAVAAHSLPGDGWIAGQRVRYLVEARRFDEAVQAARACRANDWWCTALAGFSHHYAGDSAEADSAFARALLAMDDRERARWSDLSLILDERSVRTYRRLPLEDRPAFEERFWRLANPFLTRPGNELRSEHFARHVWDQLQLRAQSTDGISWGFDLREILLRYGWPSGWERTRTLTPSPAGPPSLVSHYSSAPRYLLPPAAALLDQPGTGGAWDTRERRSRTGYNIPLADSIARWFTPLPHQIAVFRRGEAASVVAAYELPRDSLSDTAVVRAGLALLPTLDSEGEPRTAIRDDAGLSAALQLAAPIEPLLMSLEVVVPSERRLARARYGIELAPLLPGLVAVSDLLLVRPDALLPDSLDAAVAAARGSALVEPDEEIGIYWEVYGLDPGTTPVVGMSLRLVGSQTGLLRRLAQRAGLVREIAPIRLRWEEPAREGPYLPRSLAIRIPDVQPGFYALELTVDVPGREPLSVRREIEVMGP